MKKKMGSRKKRIVQLKSLDSNRLKLTYISSLLLITCLLGRIINLQVFNSSFLKNKALSIQVKHINSFKRRRSIVDRNNRLIAFDKPLYTLWAHPKYFNFPGDGVNKVRTINEVVRKLSLTLNLEEKIILNKFKKNKYGVKLFDNLSEKEAQNVRELYISGLDLKRHSKRFYPQGNIFSNIIGFVNDEGVGSSGLELHLEDKITVLDKSNVLIKDADGIPLPDSSGPNDFINDDKKVVLTLDSRLQKISYELISKQVEKWDAKRGLALVMKVNSGEILSLASVPSYNPNKFWEYDQKVFKSWYSQDLFEPGSTFKPINLALALEEKVIREDGFVNDNGNIEVGGWSISNWNKKGNGYIDYPTVLQVSSNVGMIKIMQKLNPTVYWDWLNKIGIERKLETDLYESTPGQLKKREIFLKQPIQQATASFGHGFSISPLKLVQLHAALANGGKNVIPHVIIDSEKRFLNNSDNQLFSEDVSKTILKWMESVVEASGNNGAKIDRYRIGGKTGTAQKVLNGTYTKNVVCSFVATLPIDKPEYLVFVLIDEPSKSYAYGATVAVPVAKEIIESLIVLEKIQPSNDTDDLIVNKP